MVIKTYILQIVIFCTSSQTIKANVSLKQFSVFLLLVKDIAVLIFLFLKYLKSHN